MTDSTVLTEATFGDTILNRIFKFCFALPKVAKASRGDVIKASNSGHWHFAKKYKYLYIST
jgi:hypothetical protein